ncbi:MAG: UDP-N-acetylmuramoyl-L-alanine--D-glutamate ligase [Gammaproteobacteria bacterium]|nr:UDP-N-acetylmuramoyl-L-alanine--D-glutamate ligase [Gammaproteobacteria bacterium]
MTEQRTARQPGIRTLVVGLGKTGLSCARYLSGLGQSVHVVDTREQPPGLSQLRRDFPAATTELGQIDAGVLEQVDQVIVSPGLPMDMPLIKAAQARQLPVLSDIDLFVAAARAPVIAITGSNGKSTVTCMLNDMVLAAGHKVGTGGNLVVPALDLLSDETPDFYLLELSSFQLERSGYLPLDAAVVLNISPDHQDQHRSYEEYIDAKARIFEACQHPVVNRDDPVVMGMLKGESEYTAFSLSEPRGHDLGITLIDGQRWFSRGEAGLMPAGELTLVGRHNEANALAALAIGTVMGLADTAMVSALRAFRGLDHRMQEVRRRNDVLWIDDSKGTNVGATVAAVRGLDGPLVLVAGGLSKQADFRPLAVALAERTLGIVLIGRDAESLRRDLDSAGPIYMAGSMQEAVDKAEALATPGSTVLLSPACASQDMFDDYAHRGREFSALVRRLA